MTPYALKTPCESRYDMCIPADFSCILWETATEVFLPMNRELFAGSNCIQNKYYFKKQI